MGIELVLTYSGVYDSNVMYELVRSYILWHSQSVVSRAPRGRGLWLPLKYSTRVVLEY